MIFTQRVISKYLGCPLGDEVMMLDCFQDYYQVLPHQSENFLPSICLNFIVTHRRRIDVVIEARDSPRQAFNPLQIPHLLVVRFEIGSIIAEHCCCGSQSFKFKYISNFYSQI